MALAVRQVRSARDLRQVGRFRYAVYVSEMGRPQKNADHQQLLIIDDLDLGSIVLAAWDAGRVVGTCRVSFCHSCDIGPYEQWYRAPQVAKASWPDATAILTRLMVAPERRGSLLAMKLASEAFLLGQRNGIRCALMDCNEHLLLFFAAMGWRLVGNFDHPEYGLVYTHLFDLDDFAHMAKIRSPFLRTLRPGAASIHKPRSSVISLDVLDKARGDLTAKRSRSRAPAQEAYQSALHCC